MQYWIFQATLKNHDLSEELPKNDDSRRQDKWRVTRYFKTMKSGDIVFLWQGGPERLRGVYGWGRLTSDPISDGAKKTGVVFVQVERRLSKHLSVAKIREDDVLCNMLILRAPWATNFRLADDEYGAIVQLLPKKDRPV